MLSLSQGPLGPQLPLLMPPCPPTAPSTHSGGEGSVVEHQPRSWVASVALAPCSPQPALPVVGCQVLPVPNKLPSGSATPRQTARPQATTRAAGRGTYGEAGGLQHEEKLFPPASPFCWRRDLRGAGPLGSLTHWRLLLQHNPSLSNCSLRQPAPKITRVHPHGCRQLPLLPLGSRIPHLFPSGILRLWGVLWPPPQPLLPSCAHCLERWPLAALGPPLPAQSSDASNAPVTSEVPCPGGAGQQWALAHVRPRAENNLLIQPCFQIKFGVFAGEGGSAPAAHPVPSPRQGPPGGSGAPCPLRHPASSSPGVFVRKQRGWCQSMESSLPRPVPSIFHQSAGGERAIICSINNARDRAGQLLSLPGAGHSRRLSRLRQHLQGLQNHPQCLIPAPRCSDTHHSRFLPAAGGIAPALPPGTGAELRVFERVFPPPPISNPPGDNVSPSHRGPG